MREHWDRRKEHLLSIISRKSFVVEIENVPYIGTLGLFAFEWFSFYLTLFPLKCHRHLSFAWGRIVSRFIRLKIPFSSFLQAEVWSPGRLLKLSQSIHFIFCTNLYLCFHITASSNVECRYPISHIGFTIFTIGFITKSPDICYHIYKPQVPGNFRILGVFLFPHFVQLLYFI